jgi:acylpyruvate hydrolase
MRIVTYLSDRGARVGVLQDGRVLDAWDALAGRTETDGPPTVRRLLEEDLLGDLDDALGDADTRERRPLEGIALGPPIPDPDKIVCLGLNYRSHAEEQDAEPPERPPFFAKFRNALVGAGEPVRLPESSRKVDYEAEVAFVVGRRAKEVSEAEAMDHVAGYTLFNDLSARDLQFSTPQWMPGKVFDGSAPCGPSLVTREDAGPHDSIEFSLTVNGEERQSSTTGDLIFTIPYLVVHLSRLMTLEPGDIVATGTPAGVGSLRKPRVWLKPGDEISIVSPTLGRLDTRIA